MGRRERGEGMRGVRLAVLLSGLAAVAFLTGCGSTGDGARSSSASSSSGGQNLETSSYEERGYYKVGRPYQVYGVWYTPREHLRYSQVGTASWYGLDFNGMPTAHGAKFDMNAITSTPPNFHCPSLMGV